MTEAGGHAAGARTRLAGLGSGASQPAGGRRGARRGGRAWSARGGTPNSAARTPRWRRSRRPAPRRGAARSSSRSSPARTRESSRRAPTRSSRRASRAWSSRTKTRIRRRRAARILRAAGLRGRERAARARRSPPRTRPFFGRWRWPERPFVALKLATSLDGRIADRVGRSRWISGEEARDFVHWLRAGFDAIGVGGAHGARRRSRRSRCGGAIAPRTPPLRVVFDRRETCPRPSRWCVPRANTRRCVVAGPLLGASAALAPASRPGSRLIRAAEPRRRPGRARAARACCSMVVEGGGQLAGALLREGLVDRYYWIQSPLWLGDDGVPAVAGLPGVELATADRWTRRRSGARSATTPCSCWTGTDVHRHRHRGRHGPERSVATRRRARPGDPGARGGRWRSGESIAVDGACLTVARRPQRRLRRPRRRHDPRAHQLRRLRAGRAGSTSSAPLRAGDRLGGHLVQGHVDGVGRIRRIREQDDARLLDIAVPAAVAAEHGRRSGSITVDGVSLTVNALPGQAGDPGVADSVYLAPHDPRRAPHRRPGAPRGRPHRQVRGGLAGAPRRDP